MRTSRAFPQDNKIFFFNLVCVCACVHSRLVMPWLMVVVVVVGMSSRSCSLSNDDTQFHYVMPWFLKISILFEFMFLVQVDNVALLWLSKLYFHLSKAFTSLTSTKVKTYNLRKKLLFQVLQIWNFGLWIGFSWFFTRIFWMVYFL
jgi:hypothetical protein